MNFIRPKKHLGQHFLMDKNIAKKITDNLKLTDIEQLIEIGPGKGILTTYLLQKKVPEFLAIDIDTESITYLNHLFPESANKFILENFLEYPIPPKPTSIIGNFPYNISSQIFFKILENRNFIFEVVGMIQKEVADRITAKPGNKTYGILSVLLQAYYSINYLFTVGKKVFNPPPDVLSAVIRLERKPEVHLNCNEDLFFNIVKTSFNQRRKMLSNSLKTITPVLPQHSLMSRRPEQLSVEEFILLTNLLKKE